MNKMTLIILTLNVFTFVRSQIYCPEEDGWKLYENRKCLKLESVKRYWEEARQNCKENYTGGDLVAVLDADMNDFIETQFGLTESKKPWIGAQFVNNSWRWSDGSVWGDFAAQQIGLDVIAGDGCAYFDKTQPRPWLVQTDKICRETELVSICQLTLTATTKTTKTESEKTTTNPIQTEDDLTKTALVGTAGAAAGLAVLTVVLILVILARQRRQVAAVNQVEENEYYGAEEEEYYGDTDNGAVMDNNDYYEQQ